MSLLTCPACVRVDSPPFPARPALFETAVKECKLSAPLRCIAEINVSTVDFFVSQTVLYLAKREERPYLRHHIGRSLN